MLFTWEDKILLVMGGGVVVGVVGCYNTPVISFSVDVILSFLQTQSTILLGAGPKCINHRTQKFTVLICIAG